MSTYYLYESAAGYALFQCDSIDETNVKSKQVVKQFAEFSSFSSLCRLIAFTPFTSAEIALNNAVCIQQSTVSEELSQFLTQNLPPISKKSKFAIACLDVNLASAMQVSLGIKGKMNDATAQVFRGIRTHFIEFLRNEEFKEKDLIQSQLGLSHSVSRNKIKFDVNREDKHITQAISIIEQLDKDLNTLCMRAKEWYSWHFPELARIVSDNHVYTKIVDLIGDRNNLTEEHIPQMEEITGDGDLAKQVFEAGKISMGQDINELDLVYIQKLYFIKATVSLLCTKILGQFEFRNNIQEYLKNKMIAVAPNLTTIVGENVAAKLISHAGSLVTLAKYPASTIQILGAEKALFRALKKKGNTPKYGLLYHSSFIGRANGKDKGKISRNLANKCAIAARLDNFLIKPNAKFGERMKDQLEQRLKHLTGGGPLEKNNDVMTEVLDELKNEGLYVDSETQLLKKKKKKTQKKVEQVVEVEEEVEVPVKKVKEIKKKIKK